MNCIRTRGKKSTPHPDPTDPPRCRANKQRGRGTYANDRPPIIGVISRESGECRYWVVAHADRPTSREIIEASLPPNSTLLFTDEGTNYTDVHPQHKTVCHGQREWARDDDGDGIREVHCNSCEGAGAALRTFLRPFRGVHKRYLPDYVATFETLYNAKRMTPDIVQRMGFGSRMHARPT
jgi:transposase